MTEKRKYQIHPLRIEEMRGKIRATLLVKRLEEHAFAKSNDKKLADKVMSDSQVRAALGLLGKVLPNVSETKGEIELTGTVNHLVAKRPKLTRDEWLKSLAK